MKQLARKYLWWPRLDKEIEETVKLCTACQETAKAPPSSQRASWSWPAGPWKRPHLDFAGPYQGKTFLEIVDAYSKFLEVVPMSQATTANTVEALRHIFSYFGLPEHLVTDNGTQLTSAEFKKFLEGNDIQHELTAPGHPATSGLVEGYVGKFKDKLSKIGNTGESLQTKFDRFLETFRATPTALGKSPSELLINRQLRIRLSALRAKTTKLEVKVFQDNFDNKSNFTLDQTVFNPQFWKGAKWIPGKVIEIISPRKFEVQVGDTLWKRHEEQLRPRLMPEKQYSEQICEPQVSEQNEMTYPITNEVPVSTPPFTPTKITESSKSTQGIDTPEIDPEPTTPPRPQDADRKT